MGELLINWSARVVVLFYLLRVAADVLRTLGCNTWFIAWHGQKEVMLILGPEHAASIAASISLSAD